MAKAIPVFYCVQGEDDFNHPNAFFVPRPADGSPVSFQSFIQNFPFDSNAFHFRFQVPSPDGSDTFVWLDVNPAAGGDVPDYTGRIFCKVLRMGGSRKSKVKAPPSQPRPAPKATPKTTPKPATKPQPVKTPSSKSQSPPVMSPSKSPPPPVNDEIDDLFGIGPSSPPPTSGGSGGDLKGSRLNDDIVRKIELWRTKDGKEIGGTGIRNLLCSLHTVMWSGAKWKEVSLSSVITPNAVKKAYQKAIREVHPDRMSSCSAEERLIAERIFEVLNNGWREHESKELGKK